ncbi:MAG TPA: hypothetical protein VNM87_02380 [Candidatus Udaeobacter sp.]|nr:hypothetical protein [Candidatus Udaeobacter sp.]
MNSTSPSLACARVALLASLLCVRPVAADVIDLGAKITQDVHFFGDLYTFVRIPPGAFGDYPVGTEAQLSLDAPSCNGPYCVGGFALLVLFDGRYGGALVKPVRFSMRYDEAAVGTFGVPEDEILLCRYEPAPRAWRPLPGREIDLDQNWIAAEETENIRQSVAVFASNPAPVAGGTWGAIKALFAANPRP